MKEGKMHIKKDRIRKSTAMACFKVIYQHLIRGTDRRHKITQPRELPVNQTQGLPKMKKQF
jgi:hypothetical protein